MTRPPSEIEQLTRDLVARPSVTGRRAEPAAGGSRAGDPPFQETLLAETIHAWFTKRNVRSILQPLPDGRRNVAAFVRGRSARTVVLMGHFDTVPPSPGQVEGPPEGRDDGFLYGRGSLDMKSGIAVAMTLMEEWSAAPPAVSVLFLATCDEEVESSGILRALGLLRALKEGGARNPGGASDDIDRAAARELAGAEPLALLGVVNVDYTTERYPGDPEYHAWEGTVGKVLAAAFVRGYQTHAGEYFRGFHAMGLLSRLVTAVDGNTGLSGPAPPPVTLSLKDAKEEYNVMTSPSGSATFNLFTTGKTPAEILASLKAVAARTVGEYLDGLNRAFQAYGEAADVPAGGLLWEVEVLTWSELRRAAESASGKEAAERAIAAAAGAPGRDVRERGLAMIDALLALVGHRNPAVVLAFLPPFYPYIRPDAGPFGEAVRAAVARRRLPDGGRPLTMEQFYPYISDMSYLRLEPEIRESLEGLTGEMPGWGDAYALDLGAVGAVDLPVVNVGPHGFGAHQPEERVEREYTFTILPSLLRDIVSSLE